MQMFNLVLFLFIANFASAIENCEAQFNSLFRKWLQIDGPNLYKLYQADEAAKQTTAAISSCELNLSCNSCIETKNCAWCIGERACVPDEKWYCQGEQDHVGNIGLHKVCPLTIAPTPTPITPPPPPATPPPLRKMKISSWVTNNPSGKCLHAPNSPCFNHHEQTSGICDCDMSKLVDGSKPNLKCACGSSAAMDGCCNCACGECDVICGLREDISEEEVKIELDVDQLTDAPKTRSTMEKVREEWMRIKIEQNFSSSNSEEEELETENSSEHSQKDVEKCEFVKQQLEIFEEAGDNQSPYTTLNVTEAATTSEIRRAYRTLSLQFHPDKVPFQLCGEQATKVFGFLVNSHSVLSDPDKRAAYDDYGDGEAEHFSNQYDYESSGKSQNKNFYTNSPHITNINLKLWKKLNDDQSQSKSNHRGKKIWLVEFYAPWCGGCLQFTQKFKDLAKSVTESDNIDVDIEVGAINCVDESNKQLCAEDFNIRKYPTLRMISPMHGTQHELNLGDVRTMREDAFEVAAEWLWLFSRGERAEREGVEERNVPPLN